MHIPYEHICVLIMPTDSCNMNCVYCFNSRRTKEKETISIETIKKIYEITIPFYKEVKFIWHGGEPLLMGLEFYKKVILLQKEINKYGTVIRNSIQTNLSLLNRDMAEFFVKEDIHIGSSFDGTLNELTRHNSEKILEKSKLLKEYGGKNGFICVVQKNNINHLIQDYEWFKERGYNYTINPYLTATTDVDDSLFVLADEYIKAVTELYDYWFYDIHCNVRLSYFCDFLDYILFGVKSLCCYNSCLGKHIGVHSDGSIYNCNRDFPEEYCFGNVNDYNDIRECFESEGFCRLLDEAIERRRVCKTNCRIFDFCAGGCNSCALAGGSIRKANDYMCEIIKGIYSHIANKLKRYMENSCKENIDMLNPHVKERLLSYYKRNKY